MQGGRGSYATWFFEDWEVKMESTEQRRTAVIIEDDDDIRQLLESVLTDSGFRVISTNNGLDGIEAVRTHAPVLTTLDVSMPGIDGLETARRIRGFSPTHLVIISAASQESDSRRGLEAGADEYLTKPFRPRELRARIANALRVREAAPVTERDREAAPVTPAER